jgi:chloramphenicol O-acetyltransferase type A
VSVKARYLDVRGWPRRGSFEFFRDYQHPHFSVCAPLEVGPLLRLTRASEGVSFTLAALYLSLRVANEYEPLRYRLEEGRVRIHERVDAGSTVLIGEEGLAFVYLPFAESFGAFQEGARAAQRRAAAEGARRIDAQDHRTDLLHFSSLPWISFSSITHARRGVPDDSVPKLAFGRYHRAGRRISMPVSLEVHHALMDGVHVGRFFERLEGYLAAPAAPLGRARGA